MDGRKWGGCLAIVLGWLLILWLSARAVGCGLGVV